MISSLHLLFRKIHLAISADNCEVPIKKQKQNKNYETIISFLHILYENVTWHLNIRLRGTQKKTNKQKQDDNLLFASH